jgi:outer membrane protein assembly factor BamB
MTAQRTLERTIAAWMADEAAGVVDDALLDSILNATGRARPMPRWLSLLKEPPMRIRSQVAVGSPTRRLALVASLLLLLILGTAVVAAAIRPTPAADDWPGFLGGYDHGGAAVQAPVGNPVVAWRFQAEGGVNQAIAIVGDRVVVPTENGTVHGLDRATGVERWSFDVAGEQIPVGVLAAGGSAHVADNNGIVYALDLATGAEHWRSAPLGVATNLTYGDDQLYFGTAAGEVVAIDVTTGAERWRTPVPGAASAARNPAFSDGKVLSAIDGVGYSAFDAKTGAILWTVPTGEDAMGSARVGGSTTFIGASAESPVGHLRAIDLASGAVRWVIDEPLGGPTLDAGVAYSGGQGVATARDAATGAERWRATFSGYVRGPAVAGGVVFLPADGEQRIYALDAATGGELWRFDLGAGNQCCIAAAGGLVFVGTDQGLVYAIGGDGSALTPAVIPAVTATPVPASSPQPSDVPAADAVHASSVWHAADADGTMIPNQIVQAPDGRLWVSDPFHDRFAIFTADGEFVEYWGASGDGEGQFELQRSNGDGVGPMDFGPDGSLYVLDGGNLRVQKFDSDLRFVTQWGGFGDGPGRFSQPTGIRVGSDGTVYVLDEVRAVIERYDPDGTPLGTVDPFQDHRSGFATTSSLAIDDAGNLYVSLGNPHEVVRLDPTGSITQIYGAGVFKDWPGHMWIDDEGRLYVTHGPMRGDGPGVLVFDGGGQYLGGWGQAGSDDGDLTFPAGVFADDDGNVFVGDAAGMGGEFPGRPGIQKFEVTIDAR